MKRKKTAITKTFSGEFNIFSPRKSDANDRAASDVRPFVALSAEDRDTFNKLDYVQPVDISSTVVGNAESETVRKIENDNIDEMLQFKNQKIMSKLKRAVDYPSMYTAINESDEEKKIKKTERHVTKSKMRTVKSLRKKKDGVLNNEKVGLYVKIPRDSLAFKNQGTMPFTKTFGVQELVKGEIESRIAEKKKKRRIIPNEPSPDLLHEIEEINEQRVLHTTIHNPKPTSQVKEEDNQFKEQQKADFLNSMPAQQFIYLPPEKENANDLKSKDAAMDIITELDYAIRSVDFTSQDMISTINGLKNTQKIWAPASWEEYIKKGLQYLEEWSRQEEDRYLRTPFPGEPQCVNDEKCVGMIFPDIAMRHILVQRMPKHVMQQFLITKEYPPDRYPCVMCNRSIVMWFYLVLRSQLTSIKSINNSISDYCNITGKTGEYILHQCMISSSKDYQGLFRPVAIHCVYWYKMEYDRTNDIYWYKQDGYIKPEDYVASVDSISRKGKPKDEGIFEENDEELDF